MRVPLQKNKRTVKVIRMKPVPAKCRKNEQKADKDYVSETISFVIKGKLTPIKPSFVAKKTGGVVVKKASTKKKTMKGVTDGKVKTRSAGEPLATKVQTKTASKLGGHQKTTKKSATLETNISPSQHDETVQSNKNDTSKRPTKETKALKKVKPEVADAKKKPKKAVTKRIKSPVKTEPPIDKDKEKAHKEDSSAEIQKAEDIKTKQTIEKLLKQANRALKNKVSVQTTKKVHKCEKKVKLPVKTQLKTKAKAPKQLSVKQETIVSDVVKKQPKRKSPGDSPEDTWTSDDLTLNELCKSSVKTETDATKSKKFKIKAEPVSDNEKKTRRQTSKQSPKKISAKSNLVLMKKRVISGAKNKVKRKESQRARKMKLFGFWNGPKRHRVASLNALAKVHCLYENETRSNLLDPIEIDKEPIEDKKPSEDDLVPCTRTLRSVPGLRAVGKHWDMHDTTSSSEDNSGYESTPDVEEKPKAKVKKELTKKADKKPETKRRRNRTELIMDLKDMVVRKRMASLNASAILAASYSVEKRTSKSPKSDSEIDSSDYFNTDNEDEADKKCFEAKVKKEEDNKLIEVRATPNKKVAVILNQDTDVTITGVYVNSTTRSTHHEGYCSIAGMQYRISATSHTQTAATAVATETLLQSSSSSTQENSNSESLTSCKSYTPLDALSNMQPPPGPGIQHGVPHQHMGPPQHVLPLPQHQLSPSRRHGCPSAFTAPHATPPYPPHHPPPPLPGDPGYVHGYYQPAGPLISVPHGHTQPPPPPTSIPKSVPLSETSAASTSPVHQPPPPPSSNGDSSDSEVIITSVTAGEKAPPPQQPPNAYRYSQYPGTPPGYPYSYPPHYYPTPPPAPSYAHHDLCYPTSPYLHHKYPPTTYRRFLPSTQYYAPNPTDIYASPPTGPSQPSQQVVTATPVSASSSSYQPPPSGPPAAIMEPYPPPTLVETYPHPAHYYPSYGPAPPPSCYTHSPATRTLPYINATYQSCPCPMQSCPKNVLTGPLTGDGKRSNISSIAKDSMPLPPVALALPLEPASATGPPSPARGSAGMPPPPSPAGATYQPLTPAPKHEDGVECTPVEKKRKARVGKAMVRNNIAAIQQNTMLLMCNPNQRNYPSEVKREIESPKEKAAEAKKEICSDDEIKAATVELEIVNKPIAEPQNLKREESFEAKEIERKVEDVKEELPPCVNTVAENVKMKNMKRKVSVSEKKTEPEDVSNPKKIKVESKYSVGSYKDLIKRDTTTVKINNGKRKLITENAELLPKRTKAKGKNTTKRKLSVTKEEGKTPSKRLKQAKPLTASNQQNSKQYSKEKDRGKSEPVLIENKEPQNKKSTTKKLPVNSKCGKKLAPAILDNLLTKNSIDRTIDSVISESSVRTNTSALKSAAKANKEPVLTNRKSTNPKNVQIKNKIECRSRRKSKCKDVVPQAIAKVPRRSSQMPRWSNGWIWEGQAFEAKVFLNSDETTVVRKCYPAMRHEEGDIIEVRDCVLLKAGPRKNDLPFVAKIAYLWENPDDGEMMMSLLWYYRPEHTEQGRTPADQPDEVFASRHKDSNSVACIDDKCYVLTFHEYCRYRKELRRLEEGIEETSPCIPTPEPYPRFKRQPPSSLQVSPDMVFFCRRVYDFRQKRIVKNPS